MHPVIAHMRSFRQTRATLCTEPVLAWLERDGLVHPFTPHVQRVALEKLGFRRGVEEIAWRLGYALERARDVREGEPILVRVPDGRALFGLCGPNGLFVGASFGAYLCGPYPAFLVARKI
jgi:hypothetical protein